MKILKGLSMFSFVVASVLTLASCKDDNDALKFKDKGEEVGRTEFVSLYEEAITNFLMPCDYVLTHEYHTKSIPPETESQVEHEQYTDMVNKCEYDVDNNVLKSNSNMKSYGYQGNFSNVTEGILQESYDSVSDTTITAMVDQNNKKYWSYSNNSVSWIANNNLYRVLEYAEIYAGYSEMNYKFYVNGNIFTITINQTDAHATHDATMQAQVNDNSIILITDGTMITQNFNETTESIHKLELKSVDIEPIDLTDYTLSDEYLFN